MLKHSGTRVYTETSQLCIFFFYNAVMRLVVVLKAQSFLKGKVLALVESVLGLVAEGGALVQALVVVDQEGSAPVAVVEGNLVKVQVLLGR